MNKIEVAVLETHGDPGQWAAFLARLTQRGHSIKNMNDLKELFEQSHTPGFLKAVAQLPHGTIKRFTPITIAIVGASRRFLAQARTNQVGFNYVSASLQYSDYSGEADFVVPYALMEKDKEDWTISRAKGYLDSCKEAMDTYKWLSRETDNDTAGYAAPQGLRNILIMQANHQAWDYFIRLRGCNRNTVETQYVAMLIWEALLNTPDGEAFFGKAGPDCMGIGCREGKFCCGDPMKKFTKIANETGVTVPRAIINERWPLLKGSAT